MKRDFFISYKWVTCSNLAEELTRNLQCHGYEVWLDQDCIPQAEAVKVPAHILENTIADAVRSCAHMVFFETFAERQAIMKRVRTVNGPDIIETSSDDAFNWQEFERSHMSRLLYVYPSRGMVEIPSTLQTRFFDSLEKLSEIIREHHPVPFSASV